MSADVLLQLDGVSMQYGRGEAAVTALAGVDLTVSRGELVAIMGASMPPDPASPPFSRSPAA